VNFIHRLRAELAWLTFQYGHELLSEEGYPDGIIWLAVEEVSGLPSAPGVILLGNHEGQVISARPTESLSDTWTAIQQDRIAEASDLCSIVPTRDFATAERIAARHTPAR
jgi:hypothetical protein